MARPIEPRFGSWRQRVTGMTRRTGNRALADIPRHTGPAPVGAGLRCEHGRERAPPGAQPGDVPDRERTRLGVAGAPGDRADGGLVLLLRVLAHVVPRPAQSEARRLR